MRQTKKQTVAVGGLPLRRLLCGWLLISVAAFAANGQTPPRQRVDSGTSLAGIAETLHPYYDARIEQLMVALYRKNPGAFIHGDVDRLREGAWLTPPDVDDVKTMNPAEAHQFLLRIRGGKRPPDAEADKTADRGVVAVGRSSVETTESSPAAAAAPTIAAADDSAELERAQARLTELEATLVQLRRERAQPNGLQRLVELLREQWLAAAMIVAMLGALLGGLLTWLAMRRRKPSPDDSGGTAGSAWAATPEVKSFDFSTISLDLKPSQPPPGQRP